MPDDTIDGTDATDAQHANERSATGRRHGVTGRTATSRRAVLRTIGAGALVGSLGTATAQSVTDEMEFVEADGANFAVGGDPVYFNGTNNFWITDPYSDRSQIDELFQICDDLGMNLVRTWAFCEGGGGRCLQPEPGVHDEAGLQHFDYLVARAAEYGIRLVPSLVDNWDAYGGIPQYVEWASGASEHGDFYVNQECRDLYLNHVETLVTRENTITGVEYRNDPTIAYWELANEPRLEGDDTTTISDRQAALGDWFAETSSFIKDLDPNHLVSTGMEGFYTREDGANWMFDDWTGQDFLTHHQIDTIDVCSFHMYPYHWPGLALAGDLGQDDVLNCVEWIRQHVADAREQVGKPVHLGEFNVNVQPHDLATRNDRLQAWYDALDETDASAATVWQLVREETNDHDGFQVYRSESGDLLSGYADATLAKSGSDDGTPHADAVAPTGLRVGESGEFGAAYSFDPDGSIASHDWAFSDDETATGERVAHRFDTTGTAEATLTVTGESGGTDADAERVTVESIATDSVLVEGSGAGVDGDTKEFHFAWTDVSGDVTVEARVADVAPVDPNAQAGVMVADDPTSPGALGAATITPGEGSELTRAYDSTVWRERVSDGRSPPIWLRIERSGGSVTAAASPDGSDWTEIGSGDVDLPEQAAVGLFVSSNSPGDLCAAQFDQVDWLTDWESADVGDVAVAGAATAGDGGSGGDGTAPTAPSNLTVGGTSATSVDVSWTAATDEGDSGLSHYVVSVDGGRDHTVEAGTTATTVSDLAAETTYEVGVSAVDGAGNRSDTATVEATTAAGEDGGDETPDDALVVNDYDGDPAWSSNQNDLGQWCGAGSFENGSGDVVEGTLRLEYDGGGWFQEQINRDVSEYSALIFRMSGANGGEESDVQFSVGGVDALLSDVTTDSVGTSVSDVTVDLESAGVDRSASGLSLRLNFWQGGDSTLEIESIRLE